MQKPIASAAVRPIDRLIAALTRRLKAENAGEHHAGMFAYSDDTSIEDDGGYGDPHEDTRPDFVKQDDQGWIR